MNEASSSPEWKQDVKRMHGQKAKEVPVLRLEPFGHQLAIVAKRVTAWQEITAVRVASAGALRKNHVVKNINVADMPIGAAHASRAGRHENRR
jgi:hypothetical protein